MNYNKLNTCFICFFRILAKFIHLDMTNNFNSKNSILSPPPLTLIPMEDSSFIPSTILNPPNRPFRKRYASQLSNSPSNFNRRSSKLYPDLKYTVLYTIFNNISESFLGCNSAANDKPPRSNLWGSAKPSQFDSNNALFSRHEPENNQPKRKGAWKMLCCSQIWAFP